MLLWKCLKIKFPGRAISCIFSDQIWHQMRARVVQAMASFQIEPNIVGPKPKRDQLHELCKIGAYLPHKVTKHKFGIETGDIHIFEQFTLLSIQKQKRRELDKKAGLKHVNRTFERVSM